MAVAVSVVEGLYEGVRMLPWLLFPGATEGGPSVQEERTETLHHLLEVGGSREHYHLVIKSRKKIFYQGEGSGEGGGESGGREEGGKVEGKEEGRKRKQGEKAEEEKEERRRKRNKKRERTKRKRQPTSEGLL